MQKLATLLLATLLLATAAHAQSGPPLPLPEPTPGPDTPGNPAGLQEALLHFPPFYTTANVHAVTTPGAELPPSCPAAGSRVEQKGGPAVEYLGEKPGTPDLCRVRANGQEYEAWFGIWHNDWPGAEVAYRAIQRVLRGRTGDVVGFDVVAEPGSAQWHDLIRQDGIEDISLLGTTWHTIKVAHYREGFGPNTYRSVVTSWIDLTSGMVIYRTYTHIAGHPEINSSLVPTAITPAK